MKRKRHQIGEDLHKPSKFLHPSLGIDIDGCIDEAPMFFQTLSHVWPGKVFIVSYRDDRAKAEAVLFKHNIRFDELILVRSLDAKAEVIKKEGIMIFFDDQPECLQNVDTMRTVFLCRNEGNFDFGDQKWMVSDRTGKMV